MYVVYYFKPAIVTYQKKIFYSIDITKDIQEIVYILYKGMEKGASRGLDPPFEIYGHAKQ